MFFTQVSETDWMDSATQVKAAEKADQMLQLIGYPDWLTDPSEVTSDTDLSVIIPTRWTATT